jgi:hypothetical protein
VAESDAASACEDAGIIGALPSLTAQLRPAFVLTVSFMIDPGPSSHNPNTRFSLLLLLVRPLLLPSTAHAHTSALTRNPPTPDVPKRSAARRADCSATARNREPHLLLSSCNQPTVSKKLALVARLSHSLVLHEGVPALPPAPRELKWHTPGTRT